tara:strand:+ start:6635 stop:7585 length:951 start_codon:yes stop_codon:yes gene_type:complete
MNNLKKVGLTALAGALVSVSANAADLSVTGGASLSFAGEEKQTTGNGWSMNNGVTFSASVEQDNGWNITATQVLNDDDVGSNRVFDTRTLKIDMGDSGVLTFAGTGGSTALSALDDVTPTAGEESWDDVTSASAIPAMGGGNNSFHYTNSSLMDGMTITAAYVPSDGTTEIESSSDYAIKYTGVDGLTIGAGAGEDNGEGSGAAVDHTNMYVTYAMDSFTVGYQTTESDSVTANADKDFTAIGVSYAVSDDMSISLNQSEIDYENSTLSDQEATGISVSYTMGSLSIKANHNTVDNIAGTSTDDRSGYALTLGFTF